MRFLIINLWLILCAITVSQNAFSLESHITNAVRLNTLLRRAVESNSDATIITKNGRVIAQSGRKNWNKVISVQSVTKSIVAISYLMMMRDGVARPLDTPVSEFYPQAVKPAFDQITIRNLLTHTSGIVDQPDIWNGHDIVSQTLSHAPEQPPYSGFYYSNAASMLLGDVLEKMLSASTLPTRLGYFEYLNQKLLAPLGISKWSFDRDQFGHLQTSGGFATSPLSLLKIGQLLIQKGQWKKAVVLAPEWIEGLTDTKVGPTECYALMMWLVNSHCGAQAGNISIDQPAVSSRHAGYFMDGFGGQYVVVIPSTGVVAIRTRAFREDDKPEVQKVHSFLDFPSLVSELE